MHGAAVDQWELAAWLRLTTTPGLSRTMARRLLRAFGTAEAADRAAPADVQALVGAEAAAAWRRAAAEVPALADRTAAWLAEPGAPPRALVPLGHAHYPADLLHTPDPPLLLHAEGRLSLLASERRVAIVGSRHATPQGLQNARTFAAALAQAGHTVVSGLAHGIDGAAHEGALGQLASTLAFVGTGLDRVYPAAHAGLAQRMRLQGLLVSEHPLGSPPRREHFPQRNRLIAHLGQGTLVVEAALASGSLITARLAAEAGRDVFAIPGSIHAAQSRGCHALLKQGAKLVETVDDVLEELGGGAPAAVPNPAASVGPQAAPEPLLDALGFDPVGLDALVARTGEAAHALAARLFALEVEGRVARLPGGRFQRVRAG